MVNKIQTIKYVEIQNSLLTENISHFISVYLHKCHGAYTFCLHKSCFIKMLTRMKKKMPDIMIMINTNRTIIMKIKIIIAVF